MMGFPLRRVVLALLAALLSGTDAASIRTSDQINLDMKVTATAAAGPVVTVGSSSSYLIATFPALKQVAYAQLPDNVWRPLVIGDVPNPTGVAVDGQGKRLFVSDPDTSVIWSFGLEAQRNGFLQTVYPRLAAVEGFTATWLAVNGNGDLFFTGRPKDGTINSIYRQDAMNILKGDSLHPVEVYQRANTGNPIPQAWLPSGLAVDSFAVYWGNEDGGKTHGAVVKGVRQNVGLLQSDVRLTQMSNAVDKVSGVCVTGTNLFYLTPEGVYGLPKTNPTSTSDPTIGLIAVDPAGVNSSTPWNLTSIAWDGMSTLYVTDAAQGKIYSLPSLNSAMHVPTKFVDAPGIQSISVMSIMHGVSSNGELAALGWVPVLAATLAVLLRY